MGVAVHGYPGRPHGDDAVQRPGKGGYGLQRQSVNQVEIDRPEAETADQIIDSRNRCLGLDPVHGSLHIFVEILYAQTNAMEAKTGQQPQDLCIGAARIDLDGEIAIFGAAQPELAVELVDDLDQTLFRQVGRRASAEMQLIDDSVGGEISAAHRNFVEETTGIVIDAAHLTRDDLIASAIEAGAGAERNMDVYGQRLTFARTAAAGRSLGVLVGRDAVGELLRGWIGGVSRTFPIVAAHAASIERYGGRMGHLSP